jgi:hypothetical protein
MIEAKLTAAHSEEVKDPIDLGLAQRDMLDILGNKVGQILVLADRYTIITDLSSTIPALNPFTGEKVPSGLIARVTGYRYTEKPIIEDTNTAVNPGAVSESKAAEDLTLFDRFTGAFNDGLIKRLGTLTVSMQQIDTWQVLNSLSERAAIQEQSSGAQTGPLGVSPAMAPYILALQVMGSIVEVESGLQHEVITVEQDMPEDKSTPDYQAMLLARGTHVAIKEVDGGIVISPMAEIGPDNKERLVTDTSILGWLTFRSAEPIEGTAKDGSDVTGIILPRVLISGRGRLEDNNKVSTAFVNGQSLLMIETGNAMVTPESPALVHAWLKGYMDNNGQAVNVEVPIASTAVPANAIGASLSSRFTGRN